MLATMNGTYLIKMRESFRAQRPLHCTREALRRKIARSWKHHSGTRRSKLVSHFVWDHSDFHYYRIKLKISLNKNSSSILSID